METIDGPLQSELSENEMLCNWQDRLRHLIIDFIVIAVLVYLFQNFVYRIETVSVSFFVIGLGFFYYFFSEMIFKTTLGKIVNRTRIIYSNEHSSRFIATGIRSIIRLVPFSFLTYFTLYNAPLHDLLSKTYVVRIKKN